MEHGRRAPVALQDMLACSSTRVCVPRHTLVLASVYSWFPEGFDTANLQAAQARPDKLTYRRHQL